MPTSVPNVAARVRLYRHGLGDCILVTLTPAGGAPYRLLIDCGVYQTTPGGKDLMRDVVKDVIAESGGFVDVLVVTHEHWDHVSGFNQAADLFMGPSDSGGPAGRLRVGEVWMGWTEDAADRTASRLETEKAKAFDGVVAAQRLAAGLAAAGGEEAGGQAAALAKGLSGLLGFFGVGGRTTRDAVTTARGLGGKAVRYARPSDAPVSPTPGIRIYCLGPPLDPKAIFTLMDEKEVYHAAPFGFEAEAYVDALAAHAIGAGATQDPGQPFDAPQRVYLDFTARPEAGESLPPGPDIDGFFERHYWGAAADPGQPDQQWRRIDADWLAPAEALALKLDNATNNTSLVLAIELVESGKVLLFPGDAQVGSWLSWHDLTWTLPEGATITGPDLLRRVAYLKVGHHGSHNATLKDKGLELMDADDLVAFIPVDQVMARAVGWGQMPLPAIEQALGRRTKGRWVRTDRDFAADGTGDTTAFAKRLRRTKLFYEIEVQG